jgi:ferrous iron transport protein A
MARPEPAKPLNPTPLRSPGNGVPLAEVVPLSQLLLGRRAIVARVDPHQAVARRLLDLGFIPGSEVRAVRRAPLGDPVVYEVRGTQLCLRGGEAGHIWVRVLDPEGG